MKTDTYVINLKTSPDRKEYMEKELSPYPFLSGLVFRLIT